VESFVQQRDMIKKKNHTEILVESFMSQGTWFKSLKSKKGAAINAYNGYTTIKILR